MAPTTTRVLPEHLPEFLEAFASIHLAMRRDAGRLHRRLASDEPVDAAGLVRWFAKVETAVVHHHEREDDLIWPELERRAPELAADLPQLAEDHHVLDRAMADVRSSLASLAAAPEDGTRRARAAQAAGTFDTVLADHLEREERIAFPLLARCFTPEAYAELEAQIAKGTPMRHLAFVLPWIADDLPAGVLDQLLATLPAPVRALHRWAFTPAYRRTTAPLRGAAR